MSGTLLEMVFQRLGSAGTVETVGAVAFPTLGKDSWTSYMVAQGSKREYSSE